MATIDFNFYQSLFTQPGQQGITIIEELYGSLGASVNPIQNAAQMISEFHGPYNGTSPEFHSSIQSMKESTENIGKNKKIVEKHNKKIMDVLVDLQGNYNKLKEYSNLSSENLQSQQTRNTITKELDKTLSNIEEIETWLLNEDYLDALEEIYVLMPYDADNTDEIIKQIAKCEKNVKDMYVLWKKETDVTKLTFSKNKNFFYELDKLIDYVTEMTDSKALFSYLKTAQKQDQTYKDMMEKSQIGLDIITEKIANTQSMIGRVNMVSAAMFDAPMLRQFIATAQNMHPALNAIIQQNIDKFPYFQQISESIGSFYTITATVNCIDPMSWIKTNTKDFFTNTVIRGTIQGKLFAPVSNMISYSDNMLNSMFLRNSPITNAGMVYPDYSNQEPIAHGFSNSMDVFHAQRSLNAKAKILPNLMNNVQDKLRNLNSFFPVVQAIQAPNQVFNVAVEGSQMLVNSFGRPVKKVVPTPETVMGAKKEAYSGGRDNERVTEEAGYETLGSYEDLGTTPAPKILQDK